MTALTIKEWCDVNLSPLAWNRILTRLLPHFNQRGFFLQDLKDPTEEIKLDDQTVLLISDSIRDIYNQKFDILDKPTI